eukprot:gnl/TRDRNA2_/TRDRNA2_161280_c0_seq1.p1 gnl/TRDRNA2_/TRDRNA2_161280_c0~~gnl/TRDRNA2_/TRDRNA2_161280_c0_seq1.p1  ORF type:complete len:432 (+),score=68.58 gnl/TRDRNA2_/TRDRNA2_161280_c0_seq1:185-1480(+)
MGKPVARAPCHMMRICTLYLLISMNGLLGIRMSSHSMVEQLGPPTWFPTDCATIDTYENMLKRIQVCGTAMYPKRTAYIAEKLTEYFDVDAAIKSNYGRLKCLNQLVVGLSDAAWADCIGKHGNFAHISMSQADVDHLPNEAGLQLIRGVAKSINREIFYEDILHKDTGHYATTSLVGALTCMGLAVPPIMALVAAKDFTAQEPLRILDAGSGSGYLVAAYALLTELMGIAHALVVGLEYVEAGSGYNVAEKSIAWLRHPSLFSDPNLQSKADFIRSKIRIFEGDARTMEFQTLTNGCAPVQLQAGAKMQCSDFLEPRDMADKERFHVINVGFGIFPCSSEGSSTAGDVLTCLNTNEAMSRLIASLHTDGYMLVPVCSEQAGDSYCKEELTVLKKSDEGQLVHDPENPLTVAGKFFYLGASPTAADNEQSR